ncbi:MAG: D-glycero-beta-D-manno-heptose-7-phosphate kinase [Deltaproteobacteria bacterium]|nr:D-glycero-beta-D-manno-heptose-7-phosphate kinase [Deltaproteobacteria bacterium]MBW2137170.1 D-glycero-beta-D-manno-heptose-7-phosphate kinase [Deltaproteobacteria bacterium]
MIKELKLSDFNVDEFRQYIDRFRETNILVLGDVIMDEYVWGNVSRISPEAPVPVVEVKEETQMLGGAANVINNICSLGGRPLLCGVIGEDRTGEDILREIKGLGLRTDGLIKVPNRRTSIKTRVVAQNQQVVRFDRENKRDLEGGHVTRILDFIKDNIEGLDAVIVADYGKGVVTGEVMKGIRTLIEDRDIILAVDPKTDKFEYYRGIDVITPNHHEAGAFCRIAIEDDVSLVKAGEHMLRELDCRSVLITQGKDGMTLFENGGEISHISTVAKKVFDVTGAGDTVISTFCLGLASGMDLKSAALLSNFAAGIVVGEVGTSAVKTEDLLSAIYYQMK